jgi:hypothetical protein
VAAATYRERWTGRPLELVVFGTLVVIMVGVAVAGDTTSTEVRILAPIVGAAAFLWRLLWQPHAIRLDDDGLTFVAVARRVTMPWDDLHEVREPWFTLGHAALRWYRQDGTRITTSGRFVDVERLLLTVERRAPHARVRGLRLPDSG